MLFINVPKYLILLKDNISNRNEYISHIKKYVYTADLVVWDDIATKSMTDYETENLLGIINSRLENNKSNIYTANIVPEGLEKLLGARLASRIRGSYSYQLFGPDMRGYNK